MEKSAPKAAAVDGENGSLEASLLRIVQEHHNSSLRIRHQTEKAKNDALRAAKLVSKLLVDAINSGVEESFINEKHIELEIRALASTVMRYAKQTNWWLATTHVLNTALKVWLEMNANTSMYGTKEIGDFENWMKTMDYDCKSINAALRNIHQR